MGHHKPAYKSLFGWLSPTWKRCELFNMISASVRFYFISLSSINDVKFVIQNDQWFFSGNFPPIRRWKLDLNPFMFVFKLHLTKIQGLPLQYYFHMGLKRIRSALKILLKLDAYTIGVEYDNLLVLVFK